MVTSDIDSRFDMNPSNDNEPICGDSNDDEIHEDGINTSGADQDDNDISCVPVFDLALRKFVLTAPPYQYHQDVYKRQCLDAAQILEDIIQVVFPQNHLHQISINMQQWIIIP